MNTEIKPWEPILERLAMSAACLALILGCVMLVLLRTRQVRAEDRNDGLRIELTKTSAAIGQLDSRLNRKQEAVQSVARDISEQLAKENSLRLAQAEVLARARALSEEQSRFDHVKNEISDALSKMDGEYMRAKKTSVAGEIQSP